MEAKVPGTPDFSELSGPGFWLTFCGFGNIIKMEKFISGQPGDGADSTSKEAKKGIFNMAKKTLPQPEKPQLIWEAVMKWCAFGLGFLYLCLSILRYFFAGIASDLLKAEKWAVLVLAAGCIVYGIYVKAKAPRLMYRIKDFVKGLFCPEMILLAVFFVWNVFCVISADRRYSANFWKINDTELFDALVNIFLLFLLGYLFRGEERKRMLTIVFHGIAAVLTVVMIYVLWTVCKPGILVLPDGGQIGMDGTARLCINCNPNTTGALAEVVLMMCLFLALYHHGAVRWLYAAAVPVHFAVLALSNSRTCLIATAVSLAVVAGKVVFDAIQDRSWKRILVALIAGAAVGAGVFWLRQLVFQAYEAVSHFSQHIGNGSQGGAAGAASMINLSSTNSRIVIWKAAVQSVLSGGDHLFFGVTPAGVVSEIAKWTEHRYTMYTHNQFLEVAVAQGIPGLALFGAWLVMMARNCIGIEAGKAGKIAPHVHILTGMMLMLVIANLFEATLLYYRFLPGGIFFLVGGALTALHKENAHS